MTASRRLLLALASALVTLAGCSSFNNHRGIGDAPVGPQDRTPPKVIVFSDRFSNVEFKCNGRDGVYVTTRNAAPVVMPSDPECGHG